MKIELPIINELTPDTPERSGRPDTTWWRSLEELARTPEFEDELHREFPDDATSLAAASRRDFLRLMTASLLLAGASGCDIKQPQEKIVPTARMSGHAKPGLPLYFSTAMDFAGSAIGLIVESRDGRPIKIEGNPKHPSSRGATHVFAQAATLDLYDPDRMRTPRLRRHESKNQKENATKHKQQEKKKEKTASNDAQVVPLDRVRDTITALRNQMDDDEGQGVRILIGCSSSPTLKRLLDAVTTRWPKASWAVYESINDDSARIALEKIARNNDAEGKAPGEKERESAGFALPTYDLSQTQTILSVDCDFLAARDFPPCYIRQFADARRIVGGQGDEMVRLYHLGSTPTLTSSKADHVRAVRPSEMQDVLRQVAMRVQQPSKDGASSKQNEFVENLGADLLAAGERAAVVVGRDQPPGIHSLALAINQSLGAIGKTVKLSASPQVRPEGEASDTAMLKKLSDEMQRGDVNSLLILGGNPVFTAPSAISFGEQIEKVPFSLSLVDSPNETSRFTDWEVPRSHFLEAWGDVRGHDGTASIVQPLISPMYESLSEIEILALLSEDAGDGHAAVRKTWAGVFGKSEDDPRWMQALATGVIQQTAAAEDNTLSESPGDDTQVTIAGTISDALKSTLPGPKRADPPKGRVKGERFEFLLKPDPTIWDGRFANNGWLQELPKPLTSMVWDNVAQISPVDAERLQLQNGDVVELNFHEQTSEIPVWLVPGHAQGCLTLFDGYGREVVGRVGENTGFNVGRLRIQPVPGSEVESKTTANAKTIAPVLSLRKTGRKAHLVTTQHYQTMEGRHLARAGNFDEYQSHSDAPEFAHPPMPTPEASMYPQWQYDGHKWGMSIDLTACVGCSACVIACQAENNIPVVGKTQCDMNRHMHWIRVDTYFQGPAEQPTQTLQQPVPCMHCERAPCEVVCPVAATNHSDEGLNQMVYNRCVGTRYCSNNCPYKVRRFNFLDFSDDFLSDPSLHLLSNPEVSIRSRGVMEKCTYCVQRIEAARIAAKLDDREIAEGDIRTACQAACPAQAIRFGDLNDPDSAVRAAHEHPLCYGLLEELNTAPRTRYLAEVTCQKT